MAADLRWYYRRLRCMSVGEASARAQDHLRRLAWRSRRIRSTENLPAPATISRTFPAGLRGNVAAQVPPGAFEALRRAADRAVDGHWEVLGVERHDLASPDWFYDPLTRRRAPHDRYAFSIDHRAVESVGDPKQTWELSRHHHLTVLAAAWLLTRDDRYAEMVERHLTGWWRANPFLSGVHWTSGIEVGIRLISWTWVRRLLDGWPGCAALFENNDLAAHQLRWHQEYLEAFSSTGSSANNHLVAEAAGLFIAGCAFPWFAESERWRNEASRRLERALEANTFPSGVNREQASDYHAFVTELALLAAVEGEAAGRPLSEAVRSLLGRMIDVAAAVVDEQRRPPRQGDSDDGRALVVDDPARNRWESLLAAGAKVVGRLPWWPGLEDDVFSTLVPSLLRRPWAPGVRPRRRPAQFGDAGLVVLREAPPGEPEIWCRGDTGPHGHLAIAAHAHADALSIELRHGGVDILADPGTYSYFAHPQWRAYFRSTIGHNTLELAGESQSRAGGPFLWVQHASTRPLGDEEDVATVSWSAEHDGYLRLAPPALHRRTVRLHRRPPVLEVVDEVESRGRHACRLAFHLGPAVQVELDRAVAGLEWSGPHRRGRGTLHLPDQLRWTCHRGEVEPILGWYSHRLNRIVPAVTLLGCGESRPGRNRLRTTLCLDSSA